jgi:thiamine biosynthesis lipoprotein ApbE
LHDELDLRTSNSWAPAREGCQRGHRDQLGRRRRRAGVCTLGRHRAYSEYRSHDHIRHDVRDIDVHDVGHIDVYGSSVEPYLDRGFHRDDYDEINCCCDTDGGSDHGGGRDKRRQLMLAAPTRRSIQAAAATQLGFGVADWSALGTSARLVVTDPAALAAARSVVERQLAAIDLAASRFRSDSELSHLNLAAGDWVEVSPLFARALRVARDAAQWSDGLVDPTVGAALIELGYDRTFTLVATDGPPQRVTARAAPGWRQLEVDDEGLRARVPRGVRIDLGATAKALVADMSAAAVVEEVGCGALVSLGGDIAVAGAEPAGGWPVDVTDRSDPELPAGGAGQVVAIHAGGLATSSTRARRWRRGGSQLHHLIDPRNGLPATGPWRTVSVAAPTCVLANTASTTAMILGAAAPGWLSARGFSARLVADDGVPAYVGGWPTQGERS